MACLTSKRWNFRSAGSDPIPKPHSTPTATGSLVSLLPHTCSPGWSFLFFPYILRFFLSLVLAYLFLTFWSVFLQPYAEHTALCCTYLVECRAAVCSPAPSKKPSIANRHWLGKASTQAGPSAPLRILAVPHWNPLLSFTLVQICSACLYLSSFPCLPSPVPFPLSASLTPTALGR